MSMPKETGADIYHCPNHLKVIFEIVVEPDWQIYLCEHRRER